MPKEPKVTLLPMVVRSKSGLVKQGLIPPQSDAWAFMRAAKSDRCLLSFQDSSGLEARLSVMFLPVQSTVSIDLVQIPSESNFSWSELADALRKTSQWKRILVSTYAENAAPRVFSSLRDSGRFYFRSDDSSDSGSDDDSSESSSSSSSSSSVGYHVRQVPVAPSGNTSEEDSDGNDDEIVIGESDLEP